METKMVSWKERISYSLGDAASNLTWMAISLYLMYFYTDVAGINVAVVGVIFLVARLWDACIDPFVGILIDKTDTKWGKSRPFFLWFAIPYGIMGILTFLVFGFSEQGKIIYAFITYITFGTIYSFINLPLGSMLPNMTTNYHERTVVNGIRMFGGRGASIIVAMGFMPLVGFFGKGNQALGVGWTMTIFCIVGVLLFLVTFANTRERIKPIKEKIKVSEALKTVGHNKYWWLILIASFLFWVSLTMHNQTAIYFFKYNCNNVGLQGIYSGMYLACTLVGIVISSAMAKKFSKKTLLNLGNLVCGLGLILIAFAQTSVPMVFLGGIIGGIGGGMSTPPLIAMLADTVDYGEYRTGIRAQGFLTSADSFGIKMGAGLGGAFSSWMLASVNYVPNAATQSPEVLGVIAWNFVWISIIGLAAMSLIMIPYKLDKEYPAIKAALDAKRGSAQPVQPERKAKTKAGTAEA